MDRRIIFGLGSIVALLCLVPLAGVVVAASTGSMETVLRLADTVLWRYTSTTLALVTVVAIGSIVIGTATAWLVVTSGLFWSSRAGNRSRLTPDVPGLRSGLRLYRYFRSPWHCTVVATGPFWMGAA